jgi:DNA end-binding protein Ku
MAIRAIWKGQLQVGDLACGVALYAAASTSERVAFHTINRSTGNRVTRQFVDSDSLKSVPREDQVKGYEDASGDYVILTQEEIDDAVPEADKTLTVRTFVPCAEVDTAYFDKPYFLRPADPHDAEAFALIRSGLAATKTVALAQAVLFRRVRTLLIRPHGNGMIGSTLNFDYEVRPAEKVFAKGPKPKIAREMLDLAKHIIATKEGTFDPSTFDDRYEQAVAELVEAKLAGNTINRAKLRKTAKVVDLMEALRQSANARPAHKKVAAAKKKAG